MQTFLHVGCGKKSKENTTPGFASPAWAEVRLDIDPTVKPDIVGDIIDMVGVGDQTVDAVFSSHNIEHLFIHQVPLALREFRRALKPDGFVVLNCPDLQSTAALIAAGKLMEPFGESPAGPICAHDTLYGWGKAIEGGAHFMAHRCGFTARSLTQQFISAGFGKVMVRQRPNHFDLWAIATRAQCPDETVLALAAQHLP